MALHERNELLKIGRIIRRRTLASLMSDTKWRKLFSALESSELNLAKCVFKFLESDAEELFTFPIFLYPPRPYVDANGPVLLRSIEWMLIPRIVEYEQGNGNVPKGQLVQDVERAKTVLDGIGKFPTQMSERGLLITGHVVDAASF
ncbi:MAG: DUF6678 family protein [Beijerinckiaceae bacterium]